MDDLIEYTVAITNESVATTGVVVTDTLPVGVQFVDATPGGYAGPNPLVWSVGAMDPREESVATSTVIVDGSAYPIGGNVASVSSNELSKKESDPVLPGSDQFLLNL